MITSRHDTSHQGVYIIGVCAFLLIFIVWPNLDRVEAAKSSPDVGICETIHNQTVVMLDCLSGQDNFCCQDEQVITHNNVTRWTKRCCSEKDFVLQNA